MKKYLVSVLCCFLASAAHAQRTQLPVPLVPAINYGQIAVGPDNLTRIVWEGNFPLVANNLDYAPNGDFANNAVRIDTYNIAGTLITRGPNDGPYSGWTWYPNIAVGPSDDVHLGWITDNNSYVYSVWDVSTTDAYISSTVSSVTNPNVTGPINPMVLQMDSLDNAWVNYETASVSDAITDTIAEVGGPKFGAGLNFTGFPGYTNFAFANDGTIWTAGYAPSSIQNEPTGSVGLASLLLNYKFGYAWQTNYPWSWYNNLGLAVYGMDPEYITTTPDGRTQIWWTSSPRVPDAMPVLTDLNPDGSLYTVTDFNLPSNDAIVSVAGCAFGGDGQLRFLIKDSSTGDFTLDTVNPNTATVTESKVVASPTTAGNSTL